MSEGGRCCAEGDDERAIGSIIWVWGWLCIVSAVTVIYFVGATSDSACGLALVTRTTTAATALSPLCVGIAIRRRRDREGKRKTANTGATRGRK